MENQNYSIYHIELTDSNICHLWVFRHILCFKTCSRWEYICTIELNRRLNTPYRAILVDNIDYYLFFLFGYVFHLCPWLTSFNIHFKSSWPMWFKILLTQPFGIWICRENLKSYRTNSLLCKNRYDLNRNHKTFISFHS